MSALVSRPSRSQYFDRRLGQNYFLFHSIMTHQVWSSNISSVIDSARWRSLGNKCVVREIHLAIVDVIMLKLVIGGKHHPNSRAGVPVCDFVELSRQNEAVTEPELSLWFSLGPFILNMYILVAHCCAVDTSGRKWHTIFCHIAQWNYVYCHSLPSLCDFLRCSSSPPIKK